MGSSNKSSETISSSTESSQLSTEFVGTVMKTPPALLWSTNDFRQLMIPDENGKCVFWVDMFYDQVACDFGVIPRDLFIRNMHKMPSFLLHSMLSCCYKTSLLPLSVFEHHFKSAVRIMQPDKLSVFNSIAEISMSLFCYYAGFENFGVPMFTRAITTANLIGLTQGLRDPACPLNPPDCQILAVRTWVCLYSVDYYYRLLWDLPCLMNYEIPSWVMDYFDSNVNKAQLFQEDNLISFSIYLVPLFNIGRRYFHHLDKNPTVQEMDYVIDQLSSEMNYWLASLPSVNPFPDAGGSNWTAEMFWDTYMLINYHTLFIMIMSHRFARVIDKAPMSHPCIYQYQLHADRLHSLFRGCTFHSHSFERWTAIMSHYIFLTGLIHCSLGYRDPQLGHKANFYINLLRCPPFSKFTSKSLPKLCKFIEQPFMAIEYLKRMSKVL